MNKKFIDPQLHSTRGNKYHAKLGLTGRVIKGEGFSKKANSSYSYTNFNIEGKSNIIRWGVEKQ